MKVLFSFVVGVAVGLGIKNILVCFLAPRATRVALVDETGEEVMNIVLEVGQTKTLKAVPKDDAGAVDPTVENFQTGYDTFDSGVLTAPDGSSSVTVSEDGTTLTVTALALGTGRLVTGVDNQPGEGGVVVSGESTVTVVAAEADATHIEHEEV